MSDHIQNALDALDKATPGPWIVGGKYTVRTTLASTDWICRTRDERHGHSDTEDNANATLIAAAPDLAAEVIRLRKWQSEAVQYLDDALEYLQNQISVWKEYNRHKVYQSALDDVNRLIAEAEGE